MRTAVLVALCAAAAVAFYFFHGGQSHTPSGKWQLSSTSIFAGRTRVTSLRTRSLLSGQRFQFICTGRELAMSADFGYLRSGNRQGGETLMVVVPGQRWTTHWVYVDGKFYNSDPDAVVKLLNGLSAGQGFKLEGIRGQRISLNESPNDKDIRQLARACGHRITASAKPPAEPPWHHPLAQVANALRSIR